MNTRPLLLSASLLASALPASALVYHYDGDTTPNVGTYGTWFTTIGANVFGTFPATSWSSNGSVLTMNTVLPGNGIYFGRISGTADSTATLALSPSSGGNFLEARIALSPTATDWSFYFYDNNGKGGGFQFQNDSFRYSSATSVNGPGVATTVPLDLTNFHTFSAYLYGGQTSYFLDGVYLGGGFSLNGNVNTLLLGDGSGSTPTGTGSMFVDFMTVTTAVGSESPLPIPEPATTAAVLGLLGGALALARRCGRSS